jgi:hypothetical protein
VSVPALIFRVLLAALLTSGAAADESDYLDEADPNLIDLEESMDYRDSESGRWSFDGDLRGGYFNSDVDQRDGSNDENDELTLRFRYGLNYGLSDTVRLRARLAAVCSTESCDPNLTLDSTPANGSSINGGDITLDELYVDFFRQDRIDLIVGRMQTNANTRGGVFISSLTRMTSPNVSVNWTDGAALKIRTERGWDSRFILQYNDEDGSSTLARPPLDFSDDDSRVSFFYSLENRERWGPFTQRALDVSYLPSALLVDGDQDGRVAGYWNLATRLAGEWALGRRGDSLILSGELGWAPNTQTKSTAGLSGSGDTGGVAWHMEASWMNFAPGHSLGINYGRSDAGWLISPVYRPNEETAVLRYHWRPRAGVQLEVHTRWRRDLKSLEDAIQDRKTFDWRVRLTWVLPNRAI